MFEQDKSRLDNMESSLYSRNEKAAVQGIKRHAVPTDNASAPAEWSHLDEESSKAKSPRAMLSIPVKIFLISIVFFLIAVGIAFFTFSGGGNFVSGNNVDIEITGPVSLAGGDTLSLDIALTNKNSVNLETVDLHVQYPTGAREADDATKELRRFDQIIGAMPSGALEKRTVSTVLFGAENEKKTIKVSVEYRIPGSNAIYSKEKLYEVLISSAPVSLIVTSVNEANADQAVEFTTDITSNSPSLIRNLLLKVDYPFGFAFESALPVPVGANDTWKIGDLEPGGKRRIKIIGKMSGQDGEVRVLHFHVGTPSADDDRVIATPFITTDTTVALKKSFLTIGLLLNGSAEEEVVAKTGGVIRGDFSWQNNLDTAVSDVSIEVNLSGTALDRSLISATNGFYRSSDNTIIFDKKTFPVLAQIPAGASSKVSFSLGVLAANRFPSTAVSNTAIKLDATVSAKSSDVATLRDLSTLLSRRIKVATDTHLFAESLYHTGPFVNTGPVPPKVEQDTSYTITWSLDNNLNTVSRTKVFGTLPSYVTWIGVTSPSAEHIAFNADTGQVTWDVGELKSATGITTPKRTVSFQVSLLPSLSQLGSVPVLVSDISLSGTDAFTGAKVTDSENVVTTRTATDSGFRENDDKVIR